MWEHASDDSPEHSGWRSEMLELSSWVCVVCFIQELMEGNIISEQRSRENEFLTSNNHDLLPSQQLVGDL